LEFKSVYSTSNAMKWLTYINVSNGEINWGGYDPSVNENPLQNEDEVITLQFLAKQPQGEWLESPLWTTRKFAGNTVSKDLEITPTNGILQVLKSTVGDVINPNSILIFPNPATEDVTITFNVTTTTDAHLGIYDIQGRKVIAVLDGQLPEGQYSYSKDLGKLAPGMYIVNLSLDNETPIYNKLIKQ
jgi:hypothetical protein